MLYGNPTNTMSQFSIARLLDVCYQTLLSTMPVAVSKILKQSCDIVLLLSGYWGNISLPSISSLLDPVWLYRLLLGSRISSNSSPSD